MRHALNKINPQREETDDQPSDHELWEGLQRAGYRKISCRDFTNTIPATKIYPKILRSRSGRRFQRKS